LGWVEGHNIAIDVRSPEDDPARLPALAAELVQRKVDVIVTMGIPATQAAKEATATIPIVAAAVGDPVGAGLVASLARPGGNITGLSFFTTETAGKRVELLKEVVPNPSRVAVLWNPTNRSKQLEWRETQVAARALGLTLQSVEVQGPDEFDHAFAAITGERPDALVTLSDPLTNTHRKRIVDFAATSRLPAVYTFRSYADDGGLLAYGPHLPALFRRAAVYVDKILKGAEPADLPVEQPTTFELVINLKTAQALGLTLPPTLLFQADEVIR
jgi:putative tryptophan/tyrosine transport system substrate-binding protein